MVGNWLESLDYDFQISEDCVRYRSPKASCTSCFDSCKDNAIIFEEGKPLIDHEKCTECGECLIACPVQMIEGIYPKRTAAGSQLDIREEKEPISVKELLILHACGLESILTNEEKLTQTWKNNIEEANMVLEKVDKSSFIIHYSENEKEDPSYSRRQLFSLLRKESQSLIKDVTPAKWRFNHESLDINKYYPNHQFFTISIDVDKCTLCKTCEFLCPKNCFQIKEDEFTVSSQACFDCKLCEDTCLEDAILIEPQIRKVETVSLQTFKFECKVCKKEHQTLREDDETCFVCAKRKKHNYLSSNAI